MGTTIFGWNRSTHPPTQSFCLLYKHLIAFPSGTLRSEDGDGREKVALKVNSRSFNLDRDYSKSLTLSNVSEPF